MLENSKSDAAEGEASPCSLLHDTKARFLQFVRDFAILNPHASMATQWYGESSRIAAIQPSWEKWTPNKPSPPHWYNLERFERLISAYIARDPDKTVRDFVSEFGGFSASAKQKKVLEVCGLTRAKLSDLVAGDAFDHKMIGKLLKAMKMEGRIIPPQKLGVIGRDALTAHLEAMGYNMASFVYRKKLGVEDGVPWVLEAAFAWHEHATERRLITGVNWSPSIVNPYRELGSSGKSLDSILSNQWADSWRPVAVFLHVVYPRAEFADRGKSTLIVNELGGVIIDAVRHVTDKWAKQQVHEFRSTKAHLRRRQVLTGSRKMTLKDAAYQVLEDAYLKASSNNSFPAHARQVMYAARGPILALTGKDHFHDAYFTQVLLPNYMREFPEKTKSWDVVFDARGHFHEPHTRRNIPLGTLEVRGYLRSIETGPHEFDLRLAGGGLYPTIGPLNRYRAILFIEKEGFFPLFERVKLAETYDVAIMSTKGQSVTASRRLADDLCGRYGIPLFVLHDFDIAGFAILGALGRDTRRYAFQNNIDVIDLGLRLADVEAFGLESEDVNDKRQGAIETLFENGAAPEEIEFLRQNKRVELNAFSSGDFVHWIQSKLESHGITKIIPEDDTLARAYRRSLASKLAADRFPRILHQAKASAAEAAIPPDLRARITRRLEANPSMPWDEAIAAEVASQS